MLNCARMDCYVWMERSFKVKNSQVIAVSSGKGGVGKTNLCANLGILLSKLGFKICVVDADHGLANLNIILGLPPVNTRFDEIASTSDLRKAILRSKYGIDILSATAGVSQITDSVIPEVEDLELLFDLLRKEYDLILVDTAAGINQMVRRYLTIADSAILILTAEPTSLTDSFGLIRAMEDINGIFEIVTNRVSGAPQANNIYRRFSNAVKKYIGLELSQLGYINEDPYVPFAVVRQLPIVEHRPNCIATQGLGRLSQTIARNLRQKKIRQKPLHKRKPIPVNPQFIKQPKALQTAPFDKWLQQFPQFFGSFTDTKDQRIQRFKQFREKLQEILNKNKDFAAEFYKFVDGVVPTEIKPDKASVEPHSVIKNDATWLSNMQLFSSEKKIKNSLETKIERASDKLPPQSEVEQTSTKEIDSELKQDLKQELKASLKEALRSSTKDKQDDEHDKLSQKSNSTEVSDSTEKLKNVLTLIEFMNQKPD